MANAGIRHVRSLPGNSQGGGRFERVQRTIKDKMAGILAEHPEKALQDVLRDAVLLYKYWTLHCFTV